MSTTATLISQAAFRVLGVLGDGETMSAQMGADGLSWLNRLVDSANTQTGALPFQARQVFDTVSGQSTYTMGPGGDFDTTRPMDLLGAGLLLMSSSPPVEIPRGLLTDDAYQAIQVKDLQSPQWTNVYFNPSYAGGLATVFLWPTPTTSANKCVLYRLDALGGFADLFTAYDFPYGYEEMYIFNLAKRLMLLYATPPDVRADVRNMAGEALRIVKRTNTRINDLEQDAAFLMNVRGGYNIQTGQGGSY